MTTDAPRPHSRGRIARAGIVATAPLIAVGLVFAVTQTQPTPSAASASEQAARLPSSDWTPRPDSLTGLRTLATTDQRGLRLLTGSGAKSFIAGVDLGVTTPGHQPGEVAIADTDYRRWFEQMGALGIRAVRIYTIHRPGFYSELLRYNKQHPAAPIYLVQGVYIPDETYLKSGTLYDPAVDQGFAGELADAVRAVHGDLTRGRLPGRASGTWTADVSPWLMSWIIGVEWDPSATQRTDKLHDAAPAVDGRYFRSTPGATATERWIAKHMNALAQLEASRGVSMPIAFVNWPTMDPLHHPEEPQPEEDLPGVDANHVLPTLAWPGGTFASYHAYPYYPDFLRYEPGLQNTLVDGAADPYAGYLAALKKHHAAMPVMITEVGVPSSIGSAHNGTLGRDQGGHREQDATAIDASLLKLVQRQGLSGAFLFAWTDEWFKFTWNTTEHHAPADRRQLWHDPLTNEQHFGLVAADPARLPDARTEVTPQGGRISRVVVDADASYVYLDVTYRGSVPRSPLMVTADTAPGGIGTRTEDYRIEVDPKAGSARAMVRAALDPARLDTWEALPQGDEPWHLFRLITNRTYPGVEDSTMEYQDAGTLVRGTWDPKATRYNSLSTWQVDGTTVRLRVPWAMLGLSDPSSRTALGEGKPAATQAISRIGFTFSVAGGTPVKVGFGWRTWNAVQYTERLKTGVEQVAGSFRQLNR
ncbi:MAG: hypothetical protein WAL50_08265 [Kineosporiaceae bacterium]